MTIDYPMWAVALAVAFLMAWLVQIVLQVMVWMRPLRHARHQTHYTPSAQQPGVSVLVYSRNEAESLARNLPVLLAQDYPDYEVIVLDDNSLDQTQEVIGLMEQRSELLYHCRVGERTRAMSPRKLAVLLGTKLSHKELILLTHAECLPSSSQWIGRMVRAFANPATEVVLGPVVYERRASFLSRFCQFDLMQRLMLLFGITLAVKPYAGWGQNLAFRKSTFYANRSQGYQRHLKMQPGEDDLFVADVARGGNVAVECSAESLVTDQSRHMAAAWSVDRLNRGFTSRLYDARAMAVKIIEALTRYLTVLPGLVLFAYALYVIIAVPGIHHAAWVTLVTTIVLLLIRAGLIIYAFVASGRVWHQRPQLFWPLLFDLYMPLVDLWYRCKALIRQKTFGVGRVGLM